MKKFIPTEEQINTLKEMGKQGKTRVEMAAYIGKDRCCLKRIMRDYNIELVSSVKNSQGKPYEWTDERISILKYLYNSDAVKFSQIADILGTSTKTISKKAHELKLRKIEVKEEYQSKRTGRKSSIVLTLEDEEYIKSQLKFKGIKELSEEYGVSKSVLGLKVKKMNIPYTQKKNRQSIQHPETKEFYDDISNIYFTNSLLGEKYQVHSAVIKRWRKELFGEFKTRTNHYVSKSAPEYRFEKILEKLKIAYIRDYRIGKWSLDYFLGNNLIVEINSVYWHGQIKRKNDTYQKNKIKKTMQKDIKKINDLKNKGYEVISLWENEITTANVKKIIVPALKKAIEKLWVS